MFAVDFRFKSRRGGSKERIGACLEQERDLGVHSPILIMFYGGRGCLGHSLMESKREILGFKAPILLMRYDDRGCLGHIFGGIQAGL